MATQVTLGIAGASTTEVLTGLTAGQKVVLPTAKTTGTTTTTGAGGGRGFGGGGGGGGGLITGGGQVDNRRPLISLNAVTKVYRMGEIEVKALRGIDLQIVEGEFIAIMGASGSGKSTLMNLIGCLDTPSEGTYLLEDVDVAELDDDSLAMIRNLRIGFVFQSFNLIPRSTALHNVEMPLIYAGDSAQRLERALAALDLVGLADRAHHQPSELSGGQQQRVAIARALITEPAILLADEPTGNLDTESSLEIMRLLTRLNEQGRTIVLITHEADIATFASRVVRLRDGLILSDDRQVPREPAGAEAPSEQAAAEAVS